MPISDAPAIVSVGELPPAAEAAVPVNEVVEPQADSDRVAPMVETAASVVSEEPFVEVAEPVVGDPAEPIAAAEAVIAAAPGAPASAEEEAAPPLTAIAVALCMDDQRPARVCGSGCRRHVACTRHEA